MVTGNSSQVRLFSRQIRRAPAQRSRPGSRVRGPGRLGGRFRRSPTFARLHYHGPGGLNGRVRNGNGCDPAGMVAGKPAGGRSSHAGRGFPVVGHRRIASFTPHQREVARLSRTASEPLVIWNMSYAICHIPDVIRIGSVRPPRSARSAPCGAESRSGWSSCLAVRTGRLRRSPAVHARPIDLVVFQEPMQHLLLETSSRRGLRA